MSVNSSQPCTENTIIYGWSRAISQKNISKSWSENIEKIKETEGEKEMGVGGIRAFIVKTLVNHPVDSARRHVSKLTVKMSVNSSQPCTENTVTH